MGSDLEVTRSVTKGRGYVLALTVVLTTFGVDAEAQAPPGRLTRLSLEELANLEVTSVSRAAERLADAAASVFIITAQDIRRSGATSLPEALRLAPSLHVARIDAVQYAVSARGFSSAIANKLLVLIDGRTIYSPLFSGVFWDQQDVLLEDVERIEVISGPGATLWGANAVNGVINVITRAPRDTQGALVSAAVGNRERAAAARYGGVLGERGHYRMYAKATHLEETENESGGDRADQRRWTQAGARAEWGDDSGGLVLQGDAYNAESVDRGTVAGFPLGRVALSGMNVLGRVTRQYGERFDLRFQAYFDHSAREERVFFQPTATLADVEFHHGVRFDRHRLLTGAGVRRGSDTVDDGLLVALRPEARALKWFNVFAQDEFRVNDRLELSLGLKLERNDYTGWEQLPSGRLAWKPREDQLVWGAISRAVRAPARLDREVIDPLRGSVIGGPDFRSEIANVFELGYRGQPSAALTSSVTLFLHEWDRLRSGTSLPVILENRIEGPVYGVESWTTWQLAPAWRLSGGFTALRKELRLETGSTDPVGIANPQLANDPGYTWTIRPSVNVGSGHELDAVVRRVGSLPSPSVPAYTRVDVRYGWHAGLDVELSLKAQNLFDDSHAEFGPAPSRAVFGRRVLMQVAWYP